MKKLMLLPLLVGVVWVCSASPIANYSPQSFPFDTMQAQIPQKLLSKIFEEAVPLFYSQHSIVTSVSELQTGYDEGTVDVSEIAGGNYWNVSLGGGILVVVSEDSF
jgi:hypothetical protein